MNHYEVLGIDKSATPAEIKKAYKRMAKKHHPDLAKDGEDAGLRHNAMVLVNQAYETLMDPAKREHYDLTGEEKPITSIDIEARNSILQLFSGLLAAGRVNIPVRATSIANQAKAKITEELATHRAKYAELEKRRGEVTCSAERNLWIDLIDTTLSQAKGQIVAIEHKLAIATRVTEMLKAYRSSVVENPSRSFEDAVQKFRDATRRY